AERLTFRVYRLRTLARLGEWDAAFPEAEAVAMSPDLRADAYYDMVCFYARAAEASPSSDRAESLGRQGIVFLDKAWGAGQLQSPGRKDQVQRDRDLRALRSRADFQSLLRRVGATTKQNDPVAPK